MARLQEISMLPKISHNLCLFSKQFTNPKNFFFAKAFSFPMRKHTDYALILNRRSFLMVKSDFLRFSVKDFILDESFQHWISNPNQKPSNEWGEWLAIYPERVSVVEEAKSFISTVSKALDEVVELEEVEESWMAVHGRLVLV